MPRRVGGGLPERETRMSRGFGRVSDGIRTRDRRDHNPELYQLSYAHRENAESSNGRAPQRPR